MRRDDLNRVLRDYVRSHLSPTPQERAFVSKIYESVQRVLSESACLQIGSFARFTSIRPIHDLDVLYVLGDWDAQHHDPSHVLEELERTLNQSYENPTGLDVSISRQTHSVTLSFTRGGEEYFAVDVVPGYRSGVNDYGDDMYVVPELLHKTRVKRRDLYGDIASGARGPMIWIRSDPRGYTSAATELNRVNEDFRKAVKFVKKWRSSCKEADDRFPLKSFHIEQIALRDFQQDASLDILGAVFRFFCQLPERVEYPEIPDRADPSRMIDAYLEDLEENQRRIVVEERDGFLIRLEDFSEDSDPASLVCSGPRRRASSQEAYLFDQGIPMLTEEPLRIRGRALARKGSFRETLLDAIGWIAVDRKIEFRIVGEPPVAEVFKWKVKNDDDSPEPRGEITDHRTRYDPESTQYKGHHYVDCYAIRNGVCIARARQDVRLGSIGK